MSARDRNALGSRLEQAGTDLQALREALQALRLPTAQELAPDVSRHLSRAQLIEAFGADAVALALASVAMTGQLADEMIEGTGTREPVGLFNAAENVACDP